MVLVRQELGDVLRDFRQQRGRTLRQVASRASVALGYLSEVERGQKEASSEILASVAEALDVPVSLILREVSYRIEMIETDSEVTRTDIREDVMYVPDTVPDDFIANYGKSLEAASL